MNLNGNLNQLNPMMIFIFFGVGLGAGFIDAIGGGGGLITVPALLTAGLNPLAALGTNKAQSTFGTFIAILRYRSSGLLDSRRIAFSFLGAFLGGALGVVSILHFPKAGLEPLVLVLLVGICLFMLTHRKSKTNRPLPKVRSALAVFIITAGIGFYDGFFGPGTGMLLIIAFASLWADELQEASANAKIANFGSNLASFFIFISLGWVRWSFALPMIAGQMLGGYLGAHTTIKRGSEFVRWITCLMSLLLLIRIAWQNFH